MIYKATYSKLCIFYDNNFANLYIFKLINVGNFIIKKCKFDIFVHHKH